MGARVTRAALVVIAALVLTGCGDEKSAADYEREQIQLGKECADAGGEWVWDAWAGWMCEFRRDD